MAQIIVGSELESWSATCPQIIMKNGEGKVEKSNNSTPKRSTIDKNWTDNNNDDEDDDNTKTHANKTNDMNSAKAQFEIQRLYEMIGSLQQEVNMLKRSQKTLRDFVVAQYNILLAGYLGDNRQPWFLYGIPSVTAKRRAMILSKFYEEDATTGKYKHKGWPSYVQGILSQEEMEQVEQVHEEYFAWDKRKHRILQEIKNMDADLLSLVECDNYNDFFKVQLYHLGYGSLYIKRPRQCSNDGCAIFYKHGVFTLEVWQGVEFTETTTTASTATAPTNNPKDTNSKVINKDRVGLIALFEHLSGRKVIFISTHLARNPEDPKKTTIRISQVAQLLYQLTKFALDYNVMNVPVILAGDMNATNIRQVAGVARIVFELSNEAAHPFVYTSFSVPRSSPTSVTSSRKVCIDYLLLQSRQLEVIDTYEMDHIYCSDPIPNQKHPSDHLPLVFRIGFKKHSLMIQEYAKAWALTLMYASKKRNNSGIAATTPLQPEMLFMHNDELLKAFHYFDVDDNHEITIQDLATCLKELRMIESFTDIVDVIRDQLSYTDRGQQEATEQDHNKMGELRRQSGKLSQHAQGRHQHGWKQQEMMGSGSLTILEEKDNNDDSNNKDEKEQHSLSQTIALNFDVFVKIYTNCVLLQKHYFRDDLLISNNTYSYFDLDQSGELEFDELYNTFSNVCPFEVSNEAFQELFQKLDVGQSGTITIDELFNYLVKNHCLQKEQN